MYKYTQKTKILSIGIGLTAIIATHTASARSIAIGNGAQAAGEGSIAVGDWSQASGENSVALGIGSTDNGRDNVLSIGSGGQTRELIYLGAGELSVDSTSAINGGQLYQTNQAVTANHKLLQEHEQLIGFNTASINTHNDAIQTNAQAITGNTTKITYHYDLIQDQQQTLTSHADSIATNHAMIQDQQQTLTSHADSIATNHAMIQDNAEAIEAIHTNTQQIADYGDARTLKSAKQYAARGTAAAMSMPAVQLNNGTTQGINVAVSHYDGESALGMAYARRIALPFLYKGSIQSWDVGGSLGGGGELGVKTSYNLSW